MMVGLWVAPRAAVTVDSKAGALVVLSAGPMVAQWDAQMVDTTAARSAEHSVEVMAAATVVRLVVLTAANLVGRTVGDSVVWTAALKVGCWVGCSVVWTVALKVGCSVDCSVVWTVFHLVVQWVERWDNLTLNS